ncbi:MAG TPA: GAF domain-containing protein [Caldithrix abyssi]|uniref:GAF domain-containing protein n=1 Tax=Caldithrix abyssi TaxID=187145 RepID=A0A7V1LPD8_CALAY|nr:GAF domain-containing protein [Caldithrix abyssi]
MKTNPIPEKIALFFVVLLGLLTFAFDILKFSSSLDFSQWSYLNEGINFVILMAYYYYVRHKRFVSQSDIQINLKNFIKLLAALYIWTLAWKQILSPSFVTTDFPKAPDTIGTVVYSNLITFAAIVVIVPMLLMVKNLIFYKQKNRTRIYLALALSATLLGMMTTVILRQPLDVSSDSEHIFQSLVLATGIVFYLILATHNSWITYLSRKMKYSYFLASIGLVWVIAMMFDVIFKESVAAHSLVVAAFTNLSWYFLFFYALFGSLTFLFHLPTARVFDRKMKEVASLHQLGRVIAAEFDLGKLVKIITEMTKDVIESKYTWIEVYDDQTGHLSVAATINIDKKELRSMDNHALHQIGIQVIESKKRFSINSIPKNGPYADIRSWKKDIACIAAAPLLGANDQVLGILYATKSVEFGFDPDDLNMLEAYANQAAIALENVKLIKNSLEQERLERELQIAREVQMRLLPQKLPDVPLKLETLTITAYEVGGDYYDFYQNHEDHLGIVIGDVSGKGTSAAFYMAETKGIIQSLTREQRNPVEILEATNLILRDSLERKSFITLLVADINYKKRQLSFARAGHCPVAYYSSRRKSVEFLQPGGIAVGLDKGPVFSKTLELKKINFEKDDVLAFFTDGLSEAMNKSGEEFGEERLGQILTEHAHEEVDVIKDKVINAILGFLQGQNLHDDLTLIIVKCT